MPKCSLVPRLFFNSTLQPGNEATEYHSYCAICMLLCPMKFMPYIMYIIILLYSYYIVIHNIHTHTHTALGRGTVNTRVIDRQL